MKIALPWWLKLIVIIQILPMFLGPALALTRPAFIGGPEAETINQAAFIYAARNIAVGFALIIAFALRNGPMLFILIVVRLITDAIDLPTILHFGLVQRKVLTISIFVLLYYIPPGFALWYLWKQMHRTDGPVASDQAR